MKIEIWSDVVCPFCYIGERHLALALEDFAHRADVEIVPRSFELDPSAPRDSTVPLAQALAAKFGTTAAQVSSMQEGIAARAQAVGLEFDTSEATHANTFDAHRLVHYAASKGLGTELMYVLMNAYFAHGLIVSDHDSLARLAVGVGLPEDGVRAVLGSDDFADAVRADINRARATGVNGVPFFVFDETYAVSGAQPVEAFRQVLDEVWLKTHPVQLIVEADELCTDGACAVPQTQRA